MFNTIMKLLRLPSVLRELLTPNPQEAALFQNFRAQPKQDSVTESVVLLLQCVEDPFYFGLFGQIATSLRKQKLIRVEQFVLHSLNVGEMNSLMAFIKFRFILNPLRRYKWIRLYSSFSDGIAYRSTSFRPITDLIDLCRSWVCWRNLSCEKELIDLNIEGIHVGDLVNDSFLRFKPAPTVDLANVYLWIVLWQAHRDVRRAISYFGRVRPRLFLTSYSTYIQHGIAVRVALRCGTRVFSFGNFQEFSKELSVGDWLHTKNADTYAEDFLKLDNRKEKLALAESALSARTAGTIDTATAYMRKSAYVESVDAVPEVNGAIVIFLHDFYDSPHIYRDMVFCNFWEWVCFTIDTLNNSKIQFFVKPHPNQISLSDEVLSKLKIRYSDISIISSDVTNTQLAKANIVCAVTVYGTVANEMAYLGVPTIACARHPHVSFNFCRTAKNKEEYAEILQHYAQINIDKSKMYQESLIFYYMHNLNMEEEEKLLRDTAISFRVNCAKSIESYQNLNCELQQLTTLPGYKSYISKCLRTM
jgi:hypothetical protein